MTKAQQTFLLKYIVQGNLTSLAIPHRIPSFLSSFILFIFLIPSIHPHIHPSSLLSYLNFFLPTFFPFFLSTNLFTFLPSFVPTFLPFYSPHLCVFKSSKCSSKHAVTGEQQQPLLAAECTTLLHVFSPRSISDVIANIHKHSGLLFVNKVK